MNRFPPRAGRWTPGILILGLAGIAGLIPACSVVGRSSKTPDEAAPLSVSLEIPEKTLRPGEALRARVTLRNQSDAPLLAAPLNAQSLTFNLAAPQQPMPLRCRPVTSPEEDLTAMASIEAGQAWTRDFLFTDATPTSGAYQIQTIYKAPRETGSPLPVISPPCAYQVTGERLFERDAAGLISRADAMRLVRDAVEDRPALLDAEQIRNAFNAPEWLVWFAPAPTEPVTGYRVHPYLGRVEEKLDAPTTARIVRRIQAQRLRSSSPSSGLQE